jgi:hypothetical protein
MADKSNPDERLWRVEHLVKILDQQAEVLKRMAINDRRRTVVSAAPARRVTDVVFRLGALPECPQSTTRKT